MRLLNLQLILIIISIPVPRSPLFDNRTLVLEWLAQCYVQIF